MSEPILIPFQDLYAPSLRHQTKVIQDQIESGLYVVKRFAYFLQKIMLVRKPAVQEMLKISEHEKEKLDRAQLDQMTNHVDAYLKTQNTYSQMLSDELKFVQSVLESVADPLLKWHKDAEKRKDAIIKREAALQKSYRDIQSKVQSTRDVAHKSWSSLQSDRKDVIKAEQGVREGKKNADKDLKNAEKKLEKNKSKTEGEFKKLEILIQQANTFQDSYWTKELPSVLQEWEKLELDRLQIFGAHLSLYSVLQSQAVTPIQAAATVFEEASAALKGSEEMREFVQTNVRLSGLPTDPAIFVPQLPCSSIELETEPLSKINGLLDMSLSDALQLSQSTSSKSPEMEQAIQHQYNNQQSMNSPPPTTFREGSEANTPSNAQSLSPAPSNSSMPPPARNIGSASPVVSPTLASPTSIPSLPSAVPEPASTPAPKVLPPNGKPPVCFFRAMFDFEATDEEDLPFVEGDIIALLEEPEDGYEVDDSGKWWLGAVLKADGSYSKSGTFPSNYVVRHTIS